MQEGKYALMQLAKTIAALERLRAEGVPFISIMTDPTTGGVFASFASLGDVNIAEPNALIGFAGARVSAGTIAAELPPGFQRSEFLFEHGFLDRVVHRSEMRDEVARLLHFLIPASFEEPGSEPVALPSFRPLSFLSALADRVLPDLEPEPVFEPPPVVEPTDDRASVTRPQRQPRAVSPTVEGLLPTEPLAAVEPTRNGSDPAARARQEAASAADAPPDVAQEGSIAADGEAAAGAAEHPEVVTRG